jgi:hypothetical protein
MKLISALLALFQFCSLLSLNSSPNLLADNEITGEEYAIYSALIQRFYIKEGVNTIVINKYTQFYKRDWLKPEEYKKSILEELSPISQETIEDLLRNNEKEGELARQLNLTVRYELLGKQNSAKTAEEYAKQWKDFYERYPGSRGVISLSRVGFNSERNQAIVYVENVCAGLCGRSYYVLLMKSKQGWKVEKEMRLWVS